jgi:NADPH-dependent 2,4-dienoyl-CoA reductase/sulfur reductase-like enzyme
MTSDRQGTAVVIVGAGVAGLAAAAELAPRARVTVLDRLPAVGGVLGYEHGLVRALQREATTAGATLTLGTTGVRWEDGRLLAAGPDGIRWLAANTLVYAGGTRPATLAEGPVFGSRLAGVLPAPVAERLLEADVLIGHRVVVAGGGHWARVVLERLACQSCAVTFAAEDPTVAAGDAPGAPELIIGWRLVAVNGRGRIDEAVLERDGRRMGVACDALVLAGGERPLRNVDGAVFDSALGVAYIQPHGPRIDAAQVAAAARSIAARITRSAGGAASAPGEV